MNIIMNSVDYSGSLSNGPGVRTVLFLQGCFARCEGCHNPSTWNFEDGIVVETETLARDIVRNTENKKLTITGGEPLLQTESLIDLMDRLEGFDICVYTGKDLSNVPQEIIDRVRYIKVGRYINEKRCSNREYIGSVNQRFIKVR